MLLQLNSKKLKKNLKWKCLMNLKQTIKTTINWYKEYYKNPKNLLIYSIDQIKKYEKL